MTIIVRGEKREGNARIRKSGKKLVYEDSYTYSVVTDSINTTRLQVLAAPGVPRVGFTRSGLGFAVCTDVACDRSPINPLEWTVTANFSSEVEEDTSGANESQSGDPTSWTPIAEISFETFQYYRPFDSFGQPFVNSAGMPYSSALPETRTLVRFEFEQFEAKSLTIREISARNEIVNTDSFFGKDPGTLKLTVKSAKIGYYYGYKVWRIDYSMVWREDTWIYKVLDTGPYYKDGNTIKNFITPPPGEQHYMGLLDGQGGKLTAAQPKFNEFFIYPGYAFNTFLRVADGPY